MQRWYVVQTKTGQESLAVKEISNQNITVFHPTYVEKSTNRLNIKKEKVLPLFPSYVFVQFDIARDRWKCLNNTRGCVGLVGCGETYVTPLPEGCIEEIMSNLDDDGQVSLHKAMETVVNFEQGMELGIRGDSYEGVVGEYHSHSDTRVTLILTLLGRKNKIELPIESVFALKSDGGSVSKSN